MTTHWLADQMIKGYEGGTVQTLVAPDGTVWSVGDRVIHLKTPEWDDRTSLPTKIKTIFPGDGDWQPRPPKGDADSVWFMMEDGWMVRPWLVRKI